ncbi:MAG: response regulator [Desulfobacteraceae bacterium]|nr:MAG: response regulator [Desulfobacteraceae bacterium]
MASHILIVEDEYKIASLLKDYMDNEGFESRIIDNGLEVIPWLQNHHTDLILLDLMLPGKNGTEICKEIRRFSQIPIIMVTARVEEIDRIIGLEIGADDYICKPFSPREVVARVKAVLRRFSQAQLPQTGSDALIQIDPESREVTVSGHELKLTPSEFDILKTLHSRPGKVYSRSLLVTETQGYDFEGYDRTIDSHIKNLRKKIAVHLPGQDIIVSVYGVGYKLVLPDVS